MTQGYEAKLRKYFDNLLKQRFAWISFWFVFDCVQSRDSNRSYNSVRWDVHVNDKMIMFVKFWESLISKWSLKLSKQRDVFTSNSLNKRRVTIEYLGLNTWAHSTTNWSDKARKKVISFLPSYCCCLDVLSKLI